MPFLSFHLPANWGEIIKSGKFKDVMRVLNTAFATEADARWEMFRVLTAANGFDLGKAMGAGNKKQRAKIASAISFADAAEIAEKIFPALDFIFKNEKFYENPFPEILHEGVLYRAPSSGRLSDQSGNEWMISSQEQFNYRSTNDRNNLLLIVAANYHEVKHGERLCFDANKMFADAAALKNLPDEILFGIILWYNHADAWWGENFPWLFMEAEPGGEPPDGKEIRHLIFELSGNKIDSAWDVIVQRSRQEIIYALDRLEKRREAEEEAMEAIK